MLRKFFVVCLVSLLAQNPAFGGIILSLTDLGHGGGGYSYGYAINEQGHATGVTKINAIDSRAFYWNGSMLVLGTNPNGGGSSFGFNINNNNQIVGTANSQAFRWTEAGGLVLIDPDHFGSANGLNQGNLASGSRDNVGAGTSTVVRWTPLNIPQLIQPGTNAQGLALNDAGQTVGITPGGGFFNPDPNGPLLSIPLDNPTDINNSQRIVGSVTGVASIFDFNSNTLTTIGRLNPNDPFSMALGVNNFGTVVGTSGNRGFLFDSTLGLQDVTSLLGDDYLGWTILSLEDINDRGQMIGVGRFNGADHAVILNTIAVPEPNIVGDTVKGVKAAYRMAGDAIVALCEQSDECEVKPAAEKAETRVETADEATVEAAADVLENVINEGKFNGPAKARAEKALEKLRNR